MNFNPQGIVLTGASGGLGSALALRLAEPGRHLLLVGRNIRKLESISDEIRLAGGQATVWQGSITDRNAFRECLLDFASHCPVDLLIANAGVKVGNSEGVETEQQFERVINVNLTSHIHAVQTLLPSMLERDNGLIVLVSSVAAISPSADLLSYSASKAALSAYGVAIRRGLRRTGVDVSIVLPGFIDTEMTRRHIGPRPFLMSRNQAARIICSGIQKRKAVIRLPWRLWALARLRELLPAACGDMFEHALRARIEPDDDEKNG